MRDDKQFLADIQSDDAEVRFTAWRSAGEVSPSVIPQLGKLGGSDDPGVANAAREALATLVHSVGKDEAAAARPAVVQGLLGLAGAAYSFPVRVHALRLLSHLADEQSAPAIAAWLSDAELREEAIYCLERVPGGAAVGAMLSAYEKAPPGFQQRILAAFGHRGAPEAADLCAREMRSSDTAIAVAAAKALGRIGHKPASEPAFPDAARLNEWQKTEVMDSRLRYADARVRKGDSAEGLRIYREALDATEEHWQCAAIVGIARIGTVEAAEAIFPKLKSGNSTVRITAQNAWKSMAKA